MCAQSYGGYVTLKMLAHKENVAHCGVAGAPVTDWRLYGVASAPLFNWLLAPTVQLLKATLFL